MTDHSATDAGRTSRGASDHDLRNALNGVVVSLEAVRTTLGRPGGDASAGRFLDAALAQCQELAKLLGSSNSAPPSRPTAKRSDTPEASSASAAGVSPRGYIAHSSPSSRMTQARILIADDEPAIAAGLSAILADLDYEVEIVADGEQALHRLSSERFGLVLADLKMPRVDGLTLLRELQQRGIPTECIIITGQASIGSAVQAMQSGAYDYIEKPLNAEKLSRLKALIPKALDKYAVRERNRELSSQLEGLTHYAELTGASEPMREVYRIIDAVAPSTASVLILGESGTGKELVARALHTKSDRGDGPFFALNCAALPKEILENELFGHEKGAFTGSVNEKPGAFEMASGGTLFLDEVAEMPPDIQVKLLRSIETRVVRRLGGKKEIPVDIRVVAATNKDLQQALADAELREDLYYRLAVVELYLPPLRERGGDIQLLANEFLARFSQQNGKAITGFDDAAIEWILTYSWPGNVRDLKNAVERAVVLARGSVISTAELMPRHLRIAAAEGLTSVTLPVGASLSEARRQLALRTLASTNADVAKAAKILGISAAELRNDLLALFQEEGRARDDRPATSSPGMASPSAPVAAPSSSFGGGMPADLAVAGVLSEPSVAVEGGGGGPARQGRPLDRVGAKKLPPKRAR